MSSFNKVRLRDGNEFSISEWLHQPRYSALQYDNAASINLRMFNYIPGQPISSVGLAARQATNTDTNMVRRKAMNQDEALIVMAVTYEYFTLTDATTDSSLPLAPAPLGSSTDLKRLQRDMVFELFVGEGIKKPAFGIPFEWLRQSIGTPVWVSGDAGAPVVRWDTGTGGEVSAQNQEVLRLPIYIGGFGRNATVGNSMFFEGKFWNPRGGAVAGLVQDGYLRFHLDGLGRRPG